MWVVTTLGIALTLCSVIPAALGQGALATGAPTPQAARQARRGQIRARLAEMARNLALSADQKTRIRAIIRSRRQEARAIRTDPVLTPVAKRGAILATRKSTRRQIAAVLTPEQRKRWRALRAQRLKGS